MQLNIAGDERGIPEIDHDHPSRRIAAAAAGESTRRTDSGSELSVGLGSCGETVEHQALLGRKSSRKSDDPS